MQAKGFIQEPTFPLHKFTKTKIEGENKKTFPVTTLNPTFKLFF